MMEQVWVIIGLSVLWALAGIGWSFLSFRVLQNNAEKTLNQEPQIKVGLMLLLHLLRWVLLGGLLFLAIRMRIIYALVFTIALSIGTIWQVVQLNKRSNANFTKEDDQP